MSQVCLSSDERFILSSADSCLQNTLEYALEQLACNARLSIENQVGRKSAQSVLAGLPFHVAESVPAQ